LDLYLPLYEKYGNTENMNFKIGLCYFGLGMNEEAREFFTRAKEQNVPDAYYYLALYHHGIEEFQVSIALLQAYKNIDGQKSYDMSEIDRRIHISERAENMITNPISASIYNAGTAINSEYDDYGPLITGDESMMVFTSRREGSTGNKKDPYGEYLEDIYISFRKDDKWQQAVNIGEPLNSTTHDAAVGLSADGNLLIMYRTNKDLSAGDLYLSRDVNKKWSEPELMAPGINTEFQEASASLTQDERVIYFSSNRPGGLGGKDIYRVVRLGNNEWSLPMNLGPTINTAFDEDAPFIHPNGKTLYFSSNGHQTMGGYDIFSSNLGEEYWSTPQNIGYPVNTVGNDIFFVLASDGKRGYYSSPREEGHGGHDIYAVSFENALESLRIIKGNTSNENKEPLASSITLLDEDGNTAGLYSSNSLNGNYIIILPPDKNFQMIVEAEGYVTVEDELFYQGGTNEKERIQNYILQKLAEQ
jgi:Tol biopolymer transport system component